MVVDVSSAAARKFQRGTQLINSLPNVYAEVVATDGLVMEQSGASLDL